MDDVEVLTGGEPCDDTGTEILVSYYYSVIHDTLLTTIVHPLETFVIHN